MPKTDVFDLDPPLILTVDIEPDWGLEGCRAIQQVLDDGRMTDGKGRTVDFKNTILAMTSNVGSEWIQDLTGSGQREEMQTKVRQALREQFRPEFLNRIDEIIIFNALTRDLMTDITDIQIHYLSERLADKNIEIEVTPKAKELVADRGFDPQYGARPLRRTIQRLIENPLATKLIEGEFPEGCRVVVDVENEQITFKRE